MKLVFMTDLREEGQDKDWIEIKVYEEKGEADETNFWAVIGVLHL